MAERRALKPLTRSQIKNIQIINYTDLNKNHENIQIEHIKAHERLTFTN